MTTIKESKKTPVQSKYAKKLGSIAKYYKTNNRRKELSLKAKKYRQVLLQTSKPYKKLRDTEMELFAMRLAKGASGSPVKRFLLSILPKDVSRINRERITEFDIDINSDKIAGGDIKYKFTLYHSGMIVRESKSFIDCGEPPYDAETALGINIGRSVVRKYKREHNITLFISSRRKNTLSKILMINLVKYENLLDKPGATSSEKVDALTSIGRLFVWYCYSQMINFVGNCGFEPRTETLKKYEEEEKRLFS